MRTSLFAIFIASPIAFAQSAKPMDTHVVKLGEHNFTLPKGFTIEKVAGSPQVDRPVNGSFDEEGRLYITDSSGSNDKPTEQVKNPTHRVVRLESSKKDGVFDKSVVFADKLSFLQGALWYKGSLYVAAPPVILKLTDTDGDGIADKREVWFDGKSLTGCANDVHGPYLGPNEKIYWTRGGFGTAEYTLKDGKKFKTRASHIFRADPDGKNLEVVMTGGMDNPVGVAWVYNELFFSTTFFQHPEAGKRDGLIHNTYGALYGKHHDELENYIRTGPKLSEPMTHLGPAAPSGLIAYDHSTFGEEFSENLFCAQFNMAKVSRHILKSKGATFETLDSNFVTSDNHDFHPTDVIVAPDGSLLILDTGGWYKLCCPSSQLSKKDVLGAVYRVSKIGAPQGRESKVRFVDLVKADLMGKDLRGRYRAAELATYARDVPEWKTDAAKLLRAIDQHDDDTIVDSALIRALIDLSDDKGAREGLKYSHTHVIRAALVALEQIPDAKLAFAEVQPHLNAKDTNLRDTAWWIAGRHPNWGKDLAASFAKAIQSGTADTERIAKFAGNAEVQAMLADRVRILAVVEVMGRAKLKAPPASWMEALSTAMAKLDPAAEWNFAALTALRSFPATTKHPAGLDDTLLKIARDAEQKPRERLLALVVARPEVLDTESLKFALGQLGAANPATLRSDAAEVLLNAKLNPAQAMDAVEQLPNASILDLEKLLPVFAKASDKAVGLALVKALDTPTLRAAVRSEQLKPIFAAYPETVQTEAVKFFDKLDAELKAQRANLGTLLDGTQPGDIKRGQLVFNSAKTNCATCHKIGYVGGNIGPDLTRIGSIRKEIDLLESIVLPSASFVRSYEPVQVLRLDGRVHNGVVKKDSPDEVVLAINATDEVHIPRADIDTFKPGVISVMPAGLEKQISKQELRDLLAFLQSMK